jgi:hypothetical protein
MLKSRTISRGSYKITTYKSGLTTYTYPSGDGDTCEFTMLCEVGQPYQRTFRDLLETFNLRVAGKPLALDQEPWCTDVLEPHRD